MVNVTARTEKLFSLFYGVTYIYVWLHNCALHSGYSLQQAQSTLQLHSEPPRHWRHHTQDTVSITTLPFHDISSS